ncbi:unnamed protein product [Parnassius apollo]|uniref:(apollo) hypothetical protein n=1 Tax=Parnassius apollo TaxID=110799 RepID=A0A8S3WI00_PARAO|nr:unnamed protein product [Parnassius apollo]
MNKLEVDAYFELLEIILTVDDDVLKPSCIFNMDETGLQLNNRPGHVLAEKGSKAVSTVTSTEKGETITVIASSLLKEQEENTSNIASLIWNQFQILSKCDKTYHLQSLNQIALLSE